MIEYLLEVVAPNGGISTLRTTTDEELAMRWLWSIVSKWDTRGAPPVQVRIEKWRA